MARIVADDITEASALHQKQKREELLSEATLSLDFANNHYSVFDGIGSGQTLVPYETALTHTRGSDATGYGVGKLETVAVDTKRLVRDPVTGKSQGLLVEEQRTNLLLWSEDFTQGGWGVGRATINTDAGIAPDGSLSADKLVEDTSVSDSHVLSKNLSFNYVAGTTYTQSYFVKAAGRAKVALNWRSDWFPVDVDAYFDLESENVTVAANATATIERLKNGWYRISVTATANSTGTSPSDMFLYLVDDNGSTGYTGDGTSGIYIWGAQLEAGSQPSSYIKTEASQVTRQADQVSRVLGSEFNPSEGTVFVDVDGVKGFPTLFSIDDGTVNNRIQVFLRDSDNTFRLVIWSDGLSQVFESIGAINRKARLGISYNKDGISAAVNGVAYNIPPSSIPSGLSTHRILSAYTAFTAGAAVVKNDLISPRALTEAELITLTTPEQ